MTLLEELDERCLPKWVNKILREKPGEGKEKSLIKKLYNLVHARKYEEAQIAKKLYGANATPSHAPFRTLKTRLRHILVEAFMMQELGYPSYTNYDLAYKNGYRQLSVARLLIINKAFHAAREVAVNAFKNVREYEIIPLNLGLTDIIVSLLLGLFYNEELYLKYSELNRYYNQANYDLGIVSNYYREIRNHMYAKRLSPMEVGVLAGQYVEECTEISSRYRHVSQIQVMLFSTEMTGCMLRGEYRKAINVATRGSNILSKCKGISESSISALAITRVECTIMLSDFKLGEQQISAARKEVQANTINDLALTDLAIQLGLRTGNYEFAYRQYVNVNQYTISRLLTPRHQEHWVILEACINLLIISGELTPQEDWPKLRNFRVAGFANKVLVSTRNKKGENIQILVLQAMLSIIRKKYDVAIERTSALEAYCNRYLKNDENLRNNCFFKLLLITIKSEFNRRAAERKGEATFQRLLSATDKSRLNNMELIPYEKLWEMLLRHLRVTKADEKAMKKEQILRKL